MTSKTFCSGLFFLALALARPAHAQLDPPFPGPDRAYTLGDFLRIVGPPLNLNLAVKPDIPRGRTLSIRVAGLPCRTALDLVLESEDLELHEFRPGLYVVQRRSPAPSPTPSPSPDDSYRGRPVTVIPVSFLERDELLAALRSFGPDALAGLNPDRLAWIPRRGVAVAGTPDQLERLRAVIAQIDVAPESVTVGVQTAGRTLDLTRTTGVDLSGRVAYALQDSSGTQNGTLWVTTLSGSPARFQIAQVFAVPLAQTTITGGAVVTTQQPSEIPVGLMLEVTPRVMGRVVQVDVALVDAQPTRVSDVGVDRSTRNLVTRAMLPRGGSMSIGGLETAMRSLGTPGLGALRTLTSRRQSLNITLSVR